MPDLEKRPRFNVADKVRIKIPSQLVGTVTVVTYTPGGSGTVLYRVRVPMDPEPLWLLVSEDEVEAA